MRKALMEKFIINGGKRLIGTVAVSGAKNVALKTIVAACLTEEEVVIENVPLISDLFVMGDIIKNLGGHVKIEDRTIRIQVKNISQTKISLEKAAEIRTSSMFLAPLLARKGAATIPNPGGCRIGARPIDRTIEGLRKMGVFIRYESRDGYFHAKVEKLRGMSYAFAKNSHTGTETLMLAAVLAQGRTVIENAAQEPEVDDLIGLLQRMGADIERRSSRTIVIDGVKKLHGAKFIINPDRNEVVTLAIAAILTGGNIIVKGARKQGLEVFLGQLQNIGGGFEESNDGLRFYYKGDIKPANITTSPYPGFMTDWQGPWAALMTKASGVSTIHETVYENRFNYVRELRKLGAHIELYNPRVKNPKQFYNFNMVDDKKEYFHAARIYGPTILHNGIVTMLDLRAGATLVIAALAAKGQSVIFGVEHLDRGYERLDDRLRLLGADIKRVSEEV